MGFFLWHINGLAVISPAFRLAGVKKGTKTDQGRSRRRSRHPAVLGRCDSTKGQRMDKVQGPANPHSCQHGNLWFFLHLHCNTHPFLSLLHHIKLNRILFRHNGFTREIRRITYIQQMVPSLQPLNACALVFPHPPTDTAPADYLLPHS